MHELSRDPDVADVASIGGAHELLELALRCVASRETIDLFE